MLRGVHRRAIAAAAFIVLATGAVPASAATVKAYLTRDDRLQTVSRAIPGGAEPLSATVAALLAGPSRAERRDGIATAIPRGVILGELALVNGVAYVRLSERFAVGGAGGAIELRTLQVVYTLTAFPDVKAVRILLGDEPMPVAGQDPPGAWLTRANMPKPAIVGPAPIGIRAVQRRLVELRYLPPRAVNGRLDYRTSQALLAFQAWEGLGRNGAADLRTRQRLALAKRPRPRAASGPRRIEVTRSKGVALLVEGGEVKRAIHVSAGAGGRTPRGTHRIYRKERMSWSRPFSVVLPFASYFSGGYAFHQYPYVPAYPASHGCIRIGYPDAPVMWEFASYGVTVSIV